VEVGERWHRGQLSVAQEHHATQITLSQMQRLRRLVPLSRSHGQRAIVAAVEHEEHDLGARVVADLLAMDGWEVDFLGADNPTADLVTFIKERQPRIVLLSATMPEHLLYAGQAVAQLRALPEAPVVLLGGRATRARPEEASAIGADILVDDAWDVVQQARRFATAPGSAVTSLDDILHDLGAHIRALRRSRHWSQQQLGDTAGLDRSYINGVEHGKQNLTLGAIHKLATALDVPLDQLLFASRP
jgi:methanogenic corrinoid protein MtbC1/DNA-binding XRE family transcriptional regulator